MSVRPTLLVLIPLPAAALSEAAQHYALMYRPEGPSPALWQELEGLHASQGQRVQAVLSNGSTGLSGRQMQSVPGLQIVCAWGAGYENIDCAAARSLGIALTHAPGVNDATVADHALALMLGLARGVAPLDRAVKAGHWLSSRAERPALHGHRLGLLGMGRIGQQIARRAQAFDMQVAYHSRHARPDLPYRYVPDLLGLAERSDYLVLACPGGAATRHLVNRAVLAALGPQGRLINVARGSVVDTEALIAALQAGEIAGAALDVLESEPAVPPALLRMDQVLLTPHVSGRSPQSQAAQLACLLANLAAHFERRPLPDPIP